MEYYDKPKNKHMKYYLMAFGVFTVLVFVLIYTSFGGDFNFTGSAIGNSDSDLIINENIQVSVNLIDVPNINLKGEFSDIKIQGHSSSFLYVGDEKFSLSNAKNNYIVLIDYVGKISFNSKNISELQGKVAEIQINGIPVLSASNNSMKVSFDEDFNYNSLDIEEGVIIKKLSYETSGLVTLNNGKNVFDVAEDEILIEGFEGGLNVDNKGFKLKGYIEKLDIFGESEISVSV